MRLDKNEQSEVCVASRIIPEAIVTLVESEWSEARSARGTIPPT
jgi:hypothetical protein